MDQNFCDNDLNNENYLNFIKKLEENHQSIADYLRINNLESLDIDVEEIPELSGDKEVFMLVLANIVKNATQYTFCGIIDIVINYDKETSELKLIVLDTGTGMKKK